MSDGRIVLTRTGYEEFSKELQHILTVKRPQVIERIRDARQLGDISENFDYDDAKRVQAMLDYRIKELKMILAHARVVDDSEHDGKVSVGSKVVVKDLSDGAEDAYVIVGPAEANPAEGRISHESCVGSALMGRCLGDKVRVNAPVGAICFEIVAVQ